MKLIIILLLVLLLGHCGPQNKDINCVAQDGLLYCYECEGKSCQLAYVKPDPAFVPRPVNGGGSLK